MILPQKHLSLDESLFGYGSFLLQYLNNPISVDELWHIYKDAFSNKIYSVKFSFDQFLVAIDYLYMLKIINIDKGGLLYNEACKTKRE